MNPDNTRIRSHLVVAALTLLAGGANAQQLSPALIPRVDSVFARYDSRESPGCALGVYRDGAIAYQRGYGMANLEHGIPITAQTVFYTGSVSKQFTAMSIALLAKQGKLSLDDDVRKFIPELPDFGSRITIRHFIHHTSGLREKWDLLLLSGYRDGDLVIQQDVIDLASRQKELNFKPGDAHVYNNTAYDLLSVIVSRASGKSLREYAREQIFGPLGMRSSQFVDDRNLVIPRRAAGYEPRDGGGFRLDLPNVETTGSGSVYSTIEDLVRWDESFYSGALGGPELLRLVQTPGVLNNGERLRYAFGLTVDEYRGQRRVHHGGALAGFRSMLMRFPDRHLSVAMLCNLGTVNTTTLATRVADVVLGDVLASAPAATPKPATSNGAVHDASRYTGTYVDVKSGALRRITLRDGALVVDAGGGSPLRLTPLSDGRLVAADAPERIELTITPASAGRPRRLEATVGGGPAMTFEAVSPPDTSRAALGAYAGRYASGELDVTWTLAATDRGLMLRRSRAADEVLEPSFSDAFTSRFGLLRFTRDGARRVTGFTVSSGRLWNLRFARLETSP